MILGHIQAASGVSEVRQSSPTAETRTTIGPGRRVREGRGILKTTIQKYCLDVFEPLLVCILYFTLTPLTPLTRPVISRAPEKWLPCRYPDAPLTGFLSLPIGLRTWWWRPIVRGRVHAAGAA